MAKITIEITGTTRKDVEASLSAVNLLINGGYTIGSSGNEKGTFKFSTEGTFQKEIKMGLRQDG